MYCRQQCNFKEARSGFMIQSVAQGWWACDGGGVFFVERAADVSDDFLSKILMREGLSITPQYFVAAVEPTAFSLLTTAEVSSPTTGNMEPLLSSNETGPVSLRI
jgi:hypothetical protein